MTLVLVEFQLQSENLLLDLKLTWTRFQKSMMVSTELNLQYQKVRNAWPVLSEQKM